MDHSQTFGVTTPVYHGTNERFDSFVPSERGSFGSGIYFTSRESAQHYGEIVMAATLELRNPLVAQVDFAVGEEIDFDTAAIPLIRQLFPGLQADALIEASRLGDGLFGAEIRQAVEALGHDGLIAEYPDGSREYLVYRPEQVRLLPPTRKPSP